MSLCKSYMSLHASYSSYIIKRYFDKIKGTPNRFLIRVLVNVDITIDFIYYCIYRYEDRLISSWPRVLITYSLILFLILLLLFNIMFIVPLLYRHWSTLCL
uniref:Uncharacterized protein n=1 Tax=Cacopsylla melanoneura TaxID=428564 RepID=A0A8D8Z6T6_9HEMI